MQWLTDGNIICAFWLSLYTAYASLNVTLTSWNSQMIHNSHTTPITMFEEANQRLT
jgi:hypothetical protein